MESERKVRLKKTQLVPFWNILLLKNKKNLKGKKNAD